MPHGLEEFLEVFFTSHFHLRDTGASQPPARVAQIIQALLEDESRQILHSRGKLQDGADFVGRSLRPCPGSRTPQQSRVRWQLAKLPTIPANALLLEVRTKRFG